MAIDVEARPVAFAGGRFAARVRDAVAEDALLITSVAVFCTAFFTRLADQVNQDAWLAFVSGRQIASAGIPHHETLTAWPHGVRWIDQQWLGQLALYETVRIGGLAAAAALHAVLTLGAYALAVTAARRLGASSRAVLYMLPGCLWLFVFGTWQVRTQSFSYVPFVLVLWLVVRDTRKNDWRVFLALPILAVWANVHGAVVLGAGLVALRGAHALVLAIRNREGMSRISRALVLLGGPALMVSVTPYGLAIVDYYRSTILSNGFGSVVNEWEPTSLGLATFPFFALILLTAARVARQPRVLNGLELGILILTGIAALKAERNVVWFAFASLVLLPRLSAAAPARKRSGQQNVDVALLSASVAVAAVAFVTVVSKPGSSFEATYPTAAASAVAKATAADPSLRVYSDVHYADWLLWRHPELAGKVAFDARFELLSPLQLVSVSDFQEPTDGQWRQVLARDGVLVLDPLYDRFPIKRLSGARAAREIYSGSEVAVFRRVLRPDATRRP